MRSMTVMTRTAALALLGSVAAVSAAHATAFNDLFVFGDSYSDTGSFFVVTNGPTAVGYMAQDLGITLTTSQNPDPGTSGVNFAEAGAKVGIGPTPPAINPRSLTQQVAEFQNDVASGTLTFNPATSLFMLLGGLNDTTTPVSDVTAATTAQVSELYALGARYIEIGLLPNLSPLFAESVANLNPAYTALVPQLEAEFSGAEITLSNWGPFYDSVLSNASQYGFTNTDTAGCAALVSLNPPTTVQTCTTPNSYFFYYPSHPSTAADQIVGNDLAQEALGLQAIPEPMSLAVMGTGLLVLALTRRHGKRA